MEKCSKVLREYILHWCVLLCLSVAFCTAAYGQTGPGQAIEGTVLDENGEALPGASVYISNASGQIWGVASDLNGKFRIQVPEKIWASEKLHFVITYIGYDTDNRVLSKKQTNYRIQLKLSQRALDEVVVTGYQVIDRRKVTSAVTSVKVEDILMPGMTTIDQALEGRIPDLILLKNSGEAGATARLRVRGTSTLVGNREPLWVLDGFVLQDPVDVSTEELNDPDYINYIGNAISGINPQDIERVDVLKDASATALYGTRASNGVIVITTKKGRVGPPQIRYSNQTKITIRPRYTDRAVNLMNSQERVKFGQDLIKLHYAFPSNMPMVGYEGSYYRYQSGLTTYDDFLQEVQRDETVNTDWFDLLTRDALTHSHTLSISGGTDATRYYASIGYTRENGNIISEYVNRYTATMNLMTDITKQLKANVRLNGNVMKKNHLPNEISALDYAYNTTRALPAYNPDGSLYFYKDKAYDIGQGKQNEKYNYNILNEINNSSNEYDGTTLMASLDLTYDLKSIVDLTAAASYTRSSTLQSTWFGEKSNYVAILKNGEFNDRPITGDTGKSELPYGGLLNTSNTIAESFTGRLQANFHYMLKTENFNHLFTSTMGYEVSMSRTDGISDQTRGYYKDRGMKYVTMDAKTLESFPLYEEWLAQGHRTMTAGKTNQLSGYLTLAYDFNNYVTLSASGRFDASNKFGSRSNEKFLPVWSLSTRVNLKDIFGKKWNFLNDWSIRASYGKTGNMLDGETPNLLIRQGMMDAFYGENVSTVYHFPNPNLRWEQTSQTNLGMDMVTFDGRLTLSGDLWFKYTSDAFSSVNVSPVNGVTSYQMNSGDIKNWGYSLTLSGYPIRTKDWKLYLSANASWVSNTVRTNTSETYQLQDYLNGTALIPDRPVGTFYSYKFLGLNPNTGVPMFDDYEDRIHLLSGKSLSEVVPLVMIETGNREPKLTGSFYTTLSWKQLSMNMNFTYSIGSKMRLFPLYKKIVSGVSAIDNVRKEFMDRWMRPGDELNTNIPALLSPGDPMYKRYVSHWSASKGSYNNVPNFASSVWDMYDNSDLRVVPGDYLRLSSLTVYYNLQARQLQHTPLKSLRLGLSTGDMFVIASRKLKGQDPSQANNEKAVLSIRPSYTFSLDVSF